jgi:adenosylcobyric acid synthase
LDIETTLESEKQLKNVRGHLVLPGDAAMSGYEIHLGVSKGEDLSRPLVRLDGGRSDGACSLDGQVIGTYCHGIFDQPAALSALLGWAGFSDAAIVDFVARREADLKRLADAVENSLDWQKLDQILQESCHA